MSDRARIFTKCSYIYILLMVIAKTDEIFSRLFYQMPKNPRSLVGNLVLGIHITLWRKTRVIFEIRALNCVEWYKAQNIFKKKFLEKMGWVLQAYFFKIFFLKKAFTSQTWLSELYKIIFEQNKTISEQESRISSWLCENCPVTKGPPQVFLVEIFF